MKTEEKSTNLLGNSCNDRLRYGLNKQKSFVVFLGLMFIMISSDFNNEFM